MTGPAEALILAVAAGAFATTVTKGKPTEPLRRWAKARSTWLGLLLSCHFCCEHWVVFGLVALYRPRIVHAWLPADLAVAAFFMVAVAALVSGVLARLIPFQANGVVASLHEVKRAA